MNPDDFGEALWMAACAADPDGINFRPESMSGDGAFDTAFALSGAYTDGIRLPDDLVSQVPDYLPLWSDFERREVEHDFLLYRSKFPAESVPTSPTDRAV